MDRKKSFILIILLLAIVLFSNVVYAKEDTGTGSGSVLEDITGTGGSLDKYKPGDIDGTSKLEEKAEYILGIIKKCWGCIISRKFNTFRNKVHVRKYRRKGSL